jgi:hypothetical protein
MSEDRLAVPPRRFAHVESCKKQMQNKAIKTNGSLGHLPIDSKACVRVIKRQPVTWESRRSRYLCLRSEQALFILVKTTLA